MKAIVSTPNNGKPLVLSKASALSQIKWNGFAWWHLECEGNTLTVNGKGPEYLECRGCGKIYKRQSMLNTQSDIRDSRAKALISNVYEDGDDRYVVRSQSDPSKGYQVLKRCGVWECSCPDYLKYKRYALWHCKHIRAVLYYAENERKSKQYNAKTPDEVWDWFFDDNPATDDMTFDDWLEHKLWDWFFDEDKATDGMDFDKWLEYKRTVNSRPSPPMRPSLIACKDTTQEEFALANKLDEKQIVHGDDGVLAYLINGKVTISFCGTMELATRHGITISDIQTRQAYHLAVATAKATNPKTNITQAGAHSSPKLLSRLRPNPNAETVAIGLAKRNAVLKVIPEITVYTFANKHAVEPPFDYLDAYNECVKIPHKGLGEWHVSNITKELYPDKPPADIDRDGWIAIYKACQKHAGELEANPDVERSRMVQTDDGEWVMVTETGDNKSPSPTCEYYEKGRCKRCLVSHPTLYIGHTHPKVACDGDIDSDACKRTQERFPSDFGIVTEEYNPNQWKEEADIVMANLKGMTVQEYRKQKNG